MRASLVVGFLWAASLVLAWLLGSGRDGAEATRSGRPTEAPPPPPSLASAPPAAPASPEAPVPVPYEAPAARAEAEEPPAEPDAPFRVEGVETVEDLSSRLMAYVARKLAQGPAGHRELYKTLDALLRDERVHAFIKDETRVVPLAYPWLKFFVDRDRQVVAMMETVYKTAAEDPDWFQGTDDATLEPFTEGIAPILPGIVDEETLARFRGYVEKILAQPKERLPEALQKELRHFSQALRFWAGPLSPEELAAKLRDPATPLATRLELLRGAPAEALRGVDLLSILSPAISEGHPAALSVLSRTQIPPGDVAVLDRAFLAALEQGRYQAYYVRTYLQGTRRVSWADARPFVDEGLSRGGAVAEAFAQSLVYLHERPDADYVRAVLARATLSSGTRGMLKSAFKLE